MQQNKKKVYCRVRGIDEREKQLGVLNGVQIHGDQISYEGELYNFDQVVKDGQFQMQDDIREIDQWFISYGGCATGKSTSIFGENGAISQIGGIYIDHFKDQKIYVSMIEVRGDKIIDLFNKSEVKLIPNDTSFSCKELLCIVIESFDQFYQVVTTCFKTRESSQCKMNCNSSCYPILLKVDFGKFSLQFCDMVGYEKSSLAGSKDIIKRISINNNALAQIERILESKNVEERLLLCNSTLLTKIMKNAFKNTSSITWILCISSGNIYLKETLRTLNVIKN